MAGPAGRKTAFSIRPCLNVFSLFDHMTGQYQRGKDGAWYLNGGMHHITGYAGRGNTYKTTFSTHNFITAYVRYSAGFGEIYDTEMSFIIDRVNTLAQQVEEAEGIDFKELITEGKFNLTTSLEMMGDEWWAGLRESVTERKKSASKGRVTPFIDFDGSYRTIPDPWLFNLDSLSLMQTNSTETMVNKAMVGESGLNTLAMKGAAAKSQMMAQMPIVTGAGGMYVGLVAHVGDTIIMDTYAPSQKKLSGLKGDQKLKGVPENFSFLTNNCFLAVSNKPLLDSKKLPEYPNPEAPEVVGDTDLRFISFEQLRGKAGPTGAVIDLIFSQKEGLLVTLSEFYYLNKTLKGYGMTIIGNNAGFILDLYPEVKFTRKSIRALIKSDPKFRRAVAITTALGYITNNSFDLDDLIVTPKELYDGIKEKGYDWEEIISQTVEYWYFQDQAKTIGKPTLTAMTLLHMNKGDYVAKFLKTHPATTKKK